MISPGTAARIGHYRWVICALLGIILDATGSYWPLFVLAGMAYLIAWTAFHALVPRMEPVEV